MSENEKDADLQSGEQEDAGIEVETQEVETPDDHKEDPSDKLTPDHPRFKDVLTRAKAAEERAEMSDKQLADLKTELRELKESLSKNTRTEDDSDELTEEERISLEKIERNLAKRGFVKQDDLRTQERAANLKKLGDKYDGKNGLPKFDRTDVVAYAKSHGFGDNYEAAYKEMHWDTIVEQEAIKRTKAPTPPSSEKPTAGAESSGKKRFTKEDISNMSDAEYEQYRQGLLTAIKPK